MHLLRCYPRLAAVVARPWHRTLTASAIPHTAAIALRAGEEAGLVLERLGDRLLIEPFSLLPASMSASAAHTEKLSTSGSTGEQGSQRPELLLCSQRGRLNVGNAVVGDHVVFRRHGQTAAGGSGSNSKERGVVVQVQPRRNVLQRPAGDNDAHVSSSNSAPRRRPALKPLAANVDVLAVVLCGRPAVLPSTVDRLLVSGAAHHMRCILVLNKVDQCDADTDAARALLQHYPALGYPVVEVSAASGAGLASLRAQLAGSTAVFVGQSGVGKSSLVNALVPDAHTRVGALVRSTGTQGAHTTSTGRLFHIPHAAEAEAEDKGEGEGGGESEGSKGGDSGGHRHTHRHGSLIDSPGIREMGLWHLSADSVQAGFGEIAALARRCRYRDCDHTDKARGCAVRVGLQAGLVHPSRLQHLHQFLGK